jgi:putative ABC transport system ATP-binding protein
VLVDVLSVIQNVAMPLTLDVDPIDPAFRPAAEALAREAGIPEAAWSQPLGRADAEVNVRVRLARALAPRPRLLIAEHPSAALPREAVRRVAKDVHAVAAARGAALLTLTADASWAAEAGGDVLSLRPGTGELAVAAGFVERFRRMWGGR